MNCFQHPQKPAVGHCTHCGRGLCQDCTTIVEGKLACRGLCQQEVVRERRVFAETESSAGQRKVIYETSSNVYQRAFVFSGAFGILGIACGAMLFLGGLDIAGAVLIGLGLIFLVHGIGMGRAGKKFKALAAQAATQGTQS
jgi:hypothetical protein